MTTVQTGGTWDRAEAPVLFAAGNTHNLQSVDPRWNRHILVAINELRGDDAFLILDGFLAAGQRVFIDSGIFNLTNEHARRHKCKMNAALALAPDEIDGFDALWQRYIEIIEYAGSRVWGYIELDQGGRENKVKTRARLEALGLRPIPVYHPLNDGWDYFDDLASRYDRICLGNVVQADQRTRSRILATLAERRRRYPGLWIHALGVNQSYTLLSIGPDSADTSSWLWPVRWPSWPVCAAMNRVALMPPEFIYRRGVDRDDPAGETALVRLIGIDLAAHGRMWARHRVRLEEVCS